MLSYLAAALPPDASAAARLLALQCTLRMNAAMHVRLAKGLLRSLHLDTPDPWHELERARWLRTAPERAANEFVAELLDATLLGQAPARSDRRHAADWALRAGCPSRAGTAEPLPQLASVYLAAHTDLQTGSGWSELEQMARAGGTEPAELPYVLDRLVTTGLLRSWNAGPDAEDLYWTLESSGRSRRGPTPR
ncbi:hypothetical protein [Streptomyces sp. TLI_185]|uniref:hypothetical protein n=1 Tax=Streptomyces sp. TLI_185 TaxID=2485151 RepID=UPI0021A82387|nr:hypothetical protein [Streptomyces sp. TLI_185]